MSNIKKNRHKNSNINRDIENVKDLSPRNNDGMKQLESQIRQCFGRVVYRHETHEKCAGICMKSYKRLKDWQIVLSAATTTVILTDIIGTSKVFKIIAMILSIILLGIILYSKEFSLGEVSERHLYIAKKLWDQRECYLSLLTDLKIGYLEIQEIQMKRDMLQEKMMEIYSEAPKTDIRIYNKARKSLKEIEEPVFSDEEIDKLLPKHLRKIS